MIFYPNPSPGHWPVTFFFPSAKVEKELVQLFLATSAIRNPIEKPRNSIEIPRNPIEIPRKSIEIPRNSIGILDPC